MESVSTLVQMGGYGGYVWPAYGISVVVLALVLAASLQAVRKTEAELEQLQTIRRAGKRRAAAAAQDAAPTGAVPAGAMALENDE